VIATRFPLNTARTAWVEPGRYEFNEYFIFWNTNAASRVSVNSRYTIGPFYGGYRRAYTVTPSLRLNAHFNAAAWCADQRHLDADRRVRLEAADDAGELQLHHQHVLQRAGPVQQRQPQWTSNLRFNIIHRPLSDFFLVYNERRDERSGILLSRALIAKLTYLVAF
jgi:hypothetical protein